MARYALVKDNIVENVIEASPEFIAGIEPEYDLIRELAPDVFCEPGAVYDPNLDSFVPSPDPNIYLNITVDKEIAQANEIVTASAAVVNAAGNIVPISGTYYVRIVNPAGATAKLLKVQLEKGQATVQFSLVEPDVYTIDMDSIIPKPSAILGKDIRLIIEGGA